MIVKVCGITRSDQLEQLQQQNIEMIGVNFYPDSKRFVSNPFLVVRSKRESKIVGVFVNPDLTYVLSKIKEFDLDMVQLHGTESVDFCEEIGRYVPIIKVFGIDDDFSFTSTKEYLSCAKYYLFDTKSVNYGGSGLKFNWQKLAEYRYDKPFLLSGGIQLEDIPVIISMELDELIGIDVNSGFEISPGVKDMNKVNEMLNLLKK